MAKKPVRRSRSAKSKRSDPDQRQPVIYVHGIGHQDPPEELKLTWDLALFGRDLGEQSQMAYWSDILHGKRPAKKAVHTARVSSDLDIEAVLEAAGIDPEHPQAKALALSLMSEMGAQRTTGPRKKILPLPSFLRKPIARVFLKALIGDTAAYFFRKGMRKKIQSRLKALLPPTGQSFTLVAHSQGSIVALEVLASLRRAVSVDLVTIGSPLGIREVQDFLSCELEVPKVVRQWHNFADILDPVALDKGISNDFDGGEIIKDSIILNASSRKLRGFNPHSAVSYLSHPEVRKVVSRSIRLDSMSMARFVVARDVAERLGAEERHPVLIEILEPHYRALDEPHEEMKRCEEREAAEQPLTLAARVSRTAEKLRTLVSSEKDARIDELRRFVAAHLTPAEIRLVATSHRDLRVYSIWKSSIKRKLLHRSARAMKTDAAFASYGADGAGITWAVLDTGARLDHPHFEDSKTIVSAWDCTVPGPPQAIESGDSKKRDLDQDGHGTHVAGIIAGQSTDANDRPINGIAPLAKLVVYRVLNDKGEGEDAWIIKALDHIAEQNENKVGGPAIHGVNLSLGGYFDSSVYGCGFSPICTELRRLWRAGCLVCVASGNEGKVEVETPDGELELNSPMSIGDPANLEDCIAVGSVHPDRPHTYGISSFSSRGPTADGRMKPDVVAPGERILSCNSHFRRLSRSVRDLHTEESGTSMAAPHVSGLLAAFLSVRREFRGRPDDVKKILLDSCIDIGRDRYHQGHGIPNLMKMLTDV